MILKALAEDIHLRTLILISEDQTLTDRAAQALEKTGRTLALESVQSHIELLKEELAGADIVILPESISEDDELFSLIRSIRPLIDIWCLRESTSSAAPATRSCNDTVALELFTARGGKMAREKIQRRLHQKDLLEQMGVVSLSARLGLIAETIERVASTDVSALIVGPSGSGKEIIARGIHLLSTRNSEPFVALNCGAIPEGLIESELFGHEKGAFTGSVMKREGYFSQADGGTIFLDEIGEMKPDMQVKLLRALEDGVFYPLGSQKPRRVDVRVVAATNRNLELAISEGAFREDLYFRLSGVKLTLPSLAERPGDVIPLLSFFSKETQLAGYSAGALELLAKYHWPGNVRQLKNFVMRMVALTGGALASGGDGDGNGNKIDESAVRAYIEEQGFADRLLPVIRPQIDDTITQELMYRALIQLGGEVKALRELIVENLPKRSDSDGEQIVVGSDTVTIDDSEVNTQPGSLDEMEARLMARTLQETSGNRRLAAQRLGIGERTLYRKLRKYGLG